MSTKPGQVHAQYIEATLGSFQNLTPEQKGQIALVINDFRKSPYPDRLKLMGLGFAFLDLAGEENFDLVVTNIRAFLESLPICWVHAINITANSADIVWITTSAGDSQVEYGANGRYGALTPVNSPPVIVHQQTLAGLNGGSEYHYRVKSLIGNLQCVSADHTFKTL